jgi:hypothetical protein
LRLSSARRRIDAFIEQIDVLAASSFPHNDGKKALAAIRAHFVEFRLSLELPEGVRPDVVEQLCVTLLEDVANHTEILGIILRSTNVRNPFELHFVVKRLITRALGMELNLLISSEWSYVPFTYPMNIDKLPDFIMIGTPAPEAGNPLLIPLAGHEIGHSAWRAFGCTLTYSDTVTDKVLKELESNKKASRQLVQAAPLGALGLARVADQCATQVMHQIEEVFCDLFGLYLFGASFIAAFDYLLGPGGADRDLSYPSDRQRMEFIAEAARDLNIGFDGIMAEHWIIAQTRHSDMAAGEIIDAVTIAMVPQVKADLFQKLESRGLAPPGEGVMKEVLAAFRRGEPYHERVELGEIVSAGWLRLRELDDMPDLRPDVANGATDDHRIKAFKALADLVLKTVEVSEYYDRVNINAEC